MIRIYLFIIVLAFQTTFSQNQPVTVLSNKWYEKVNMGILNESDPFSAANSEISLGANNSPNRQSVGGVRTDKYFVYEMVLKNESNQNIIGIAWDYVFLDSQGKVERTRKNFNYFRQKIKKNKKATLIGRTSNPPNLVLNAKDYENSETKPKEVIEINCIVFEDKTTWKRPGVDEKVCENLRFQMRNQEKRLKRYE